MAILESEWIITIPLLVNISITFGCCVRIIIFTAKSGPGNLWEFLLLWLKHIAESTWASVYCLLSGLYLLHGQRGEFGLKNWPNLGGCEISDDLCVNMDPYVSMQIFWDYNGRSSVGSNRVVAAQVTPTYFSLTHCSDCCLLSCADRGVHLLSILSQKWTG